MQPSCTVSGIQHHIQIRGSIQQSQTRQSSPHFITSKVNHFLSQLLLWTSLSYFHIIASPLGSSKQYAHSSQCHVIYSLATHLMRDSQLIWALLTPKFNKPELLFTTAVPISQIQKAQPENCRRRQRRLHQNLKRLHIELIYLWKV